LDTRILVDFSGDGAAALQALPRAGGDHRPRVGGNSLAQQESRIPIRAYAHHVNAVHLRAGNQQGPEKPGRGSSHAGGKSIGQPFRSITIDQHRPTGDNLHQFLTHGRGQNTAFLAILQHSRQQHGKKREENVGCRNF